MAYLAEGEIGRKIENRTRHAVSSETVVHLKDIVVRYPGLDRPALSTAELIIRPGERIAVIGPSGGGKTTLLRLLNGTLQPAEGWIEILNQRLDPQGKQPRELRRRTGMIFQDFALVERATVLQNVLSGRLGFAHPWLSLFGKFSDEDRRLAHDAVAEVGLLGKIQVRVDKLSGGQRQRVAIARVLAQGPEIIFADEPVSNLDPALTKDMIDLLTAACRKREATLVMAVHQPELARSTMDRIIAVREGGIVFDAPSSALTERALSEIYGRHDDDAELVVTHRTPA